jgi:superfamily II DNA or RNA helicase
VEITAYLDDCVEAEVEGSARSPYQVVLDWSAAGQGILRATCSCPHYEDGFLCKHIWATILAADALGLGNDLPASRRLNVVHDDNMQEEELGLDDAPFARPGNRPPAGTFPGFDRNGAFIRPAPAHWKQQLPTAQGHEKGAGSHPTRDWRDRTPTYSEAWYVVNVTSSLEQGNLVIDFYQRQRKKDGQLGKWKRLEVPRKENAPISNPEDGELLQLLLGNQPQSDSHYPSYYHYNHAYDDRQTYSRTAVAPAMYDLLLPRLADTGRFLWLLNTSLPAEEGRPVAWDDGPPWQFRVRITQDDDRQAWQLAGELFRADEAISLQQAVLLLARGLVLFPDRLGRLDASDSFAWVAALRKTSSIQVPYRDRDEFLAQLWSTSQLPELDLPENLRVTQVRPEPRGKISIKSPERFGRTNQLNGDVTFVYDDQLVSLDDAQSARFDAGQQRVILRSPAREEELLQELRDLGMHPPAYSYYHREADVQFAKNRLPEVVDRLTASGWAVECEGRLIRRPGSFHLSVTSTIDWFELDAKLDFDGVSASLPSLLKAVRNRDKYILLDDGSHGMLPEEWLQRYGQLVEMGEQEDGTLRFAPSQALLLDALLAEQDQVEIDAGFAQFRQKLHDFAGVEPVAEPRGFAGELRTYQREGLGWLGFLREFRFGGCLADDMGLGKTVQVLAMLQSRRLGRIPKGQERKPSIAVVPKSLVFNWIDEAARFTPRLRVLDYTGLDRAQRLAECPGYDLLVTTYGVLRRDIVPLRELHFDHAILDEAQAIKNAGSQAAKACRLLRADHRLAMTGTPVENHLGELWSLFEFLNPGMLGRSSAFQTLTRTRTNGEQDDQTLPMLSRALRPFILRRTKQQVLSELPEKNEQTLHCEMMPKQRKLYDELREYYRASLAKRVREVGIKRAKIHVLEALLRLRQAACHPGLIDRQRAAEPSAKLDLLMEQIAEVVDEGHKALVFSQFTSLLAIVRDRFDSQGICYEYLDGRTRRRDLKVKRFQEDGDCPVFLISLKAGGHGLNLTAADYVYILDPWWNPAVEAQAVDRAHRIGQTRRVFAYRLICRDTVEEKIVALQHEKRELAEAIISADNSLIRSLSADDLQILLS